ncbi:ead/Ea22-like family protein [Escherichia coli]|nr:ead/Ea22-like family protein [Escherichia coli]
MTYGCTGATYDDKGCYYAEGRSIADDHYGLSRVTVIDVSDPEVLALLDERERNQQYIKSRDQENEDIALTVGKLRVELEAEKQRAKDLFMENARLKSGIAGLIHLGIRYADVEVMKIAGDAQLSTPCTDSIINSIATGIRIKGE